MISTERSEWRNLARACPECNRREITFVHMQKRQANESEILNSNF
ncbi:MAG: hypothetical protein H8D56_10105 [Planctomycetes bacterium]|nr:hypothetical protein [Planctomycetota bacterium]MBL7145701.1 hypothetical protein [Phycisphaerae bacterium]